ncbi:MAG TPA: hypothetical protein PKV27_06890 [Ilumatobacteraceae bacterium]|nr:hypothetical protein [Ilumatobacteraceae bacterium]
MVTSGHWEIGNDYSAGYFYQAIAESAADFALHRIEYPYSMLTDIDIHGHAAVLATGPAANPFTSVMWNDGQRTFVVGGYGGVSSDDTMAIARALRPATEVEWRTLQQETVDRMKQRQQQADSIGGATTTILAPSTP